MAELFNDKQAQVFFDAISSLENSEECRDFFLDLCTIKELESMVQRFQVACLLSEGKVYNEIVAETGASTATISRVNRALSYGENGYRSVISKLEDNKNE